MITVCVQPVHVRLYFPFEYRGKILRRDNSIIIQLPFYKRVSVHAYTLMSLFHLKPDILSIRKIRRRFARTRARIVYTISSDLSLRSSIAPAATRNLVFFFIFIQQCTFPSASIAMVCNQAQLFRKLSTHIRTSRMCICLSITLRGTSANQSREV